MVFKKGDNKPEGSGIKKGQKHSLTLAKEERRAIFEAEVSSVFVDKIHEARPEYLLDQFIGKSPDTRVNIILDAKPNERARELANKLLRLHG